MLDSNLSVEEIFERNRRWSDRQVAADPDFFSNLTGQQAPTFLWVGCSDSRVPANEILDMQPGEVFVHRNIANVVVPSDLNFLSVLQYATEVLKIRQIIVCGHYGCGGVIASMSPEPHGLIDNWLNHIRKVQRFHAAAMAEPKTEKERQDLLCELNVIEQVNNVAETTVIQGAWAEGEPVEILGLVYSLENGILKHLCTRSSTT